MKVRWLFSLALAHVFSFWAVKAAPLERTVFTNSFKPLTKEVSLLGTARLGGNVPFQIALNMRDLSGLQARLSAGEVIPMAQMVANYFPSAADYQVLLQWLQHQNLKILKTYPNHLTVTVEGTAQEVTRALEVPLAQVQVRGKTYISAQTAPSLPQHLARFVLGINGLQPYQQFHPQHDKVGEVQPFSPSSPFTPPHAVNEVLSAYNAQNLTVSGAGQRIAILIDTFPGDTDLAGFWSANAVAQSLDRIEKIQAVEGVLPPPSGEESLDVEWSSAIAPSARIRVYASRTLRFTDIDTTFQRLLSDLVSGVAIQQLSISLGACEEDISSSQLSTDNNFLAALAGLGVSIFAASGDRGSSGGCSDPPGVDFFASSPNVTAVGGTSLRLDASGTVRSESGWSGSGGGSSGFFDRPSWQEASTIATITRQRRIPDVSLLADPATGAYVVLNNQVNQIGGTSLSAPIWAGFAALFNQARADIGKTRLGLLNPRLYPLLGTDNFRDITEGSNGGFSAVSGYDRVTGIGVPVVQRLLETLRASP
ncbi:S53 family peptidase [Anthocerotibacter panamensis]|uniref:S53 family peptidase n=1 Tax=Anthocerotibacter panamensis TaxID=2857077 RepID=UPI001C4025E7|nr:S53 family peptidase [Anthocerotibacter panamensis]